MSIIPLPVSDLVAKVQNQINDESQTFKDANLKRVDALLYAIDAGETFSQLYDMFHNAPNKGEVVTDLGTYKGWIDFLKQQGYTYNTVSSYIFMYQHRQEYAELKLISKDPADIASGAAGHRKIASIKAVKWYLQKIAEEGEHIRGTLTACDYQAEVQSNHKKVKQQKYVPIAEYNKLKLEYNLLKQELDELKAKQLQLG
jgi:hypothetical protein